jgi:2'-5' RNA ligase
MTVSPPTLRVFVALDLPVPAKAILRQAVQELSDALPAGIRWVDPAGIHLTLKFLGDVDAGRVPDLLDSMERASTRFESSSLSLSLSGLGVFPNDREPRVLWAGVTGDLAQLGRLQALVDEELSELGFARERRPFRPHLTLGRVRDQVKPEDKRRIGETMGKARLPGSHRWDTRDMHLIRSTLTPKGAIYDSIGFMLLAAGERVQP